MADEKGKKSSATLGGSVHTHPVYEKQPSLDVMARNIQRLVDKTQMLHGISASKPQAFRGLDALTFLRTVLETNGVDASKNQDIFNAVKLVVESLSVYINANRLSGITNLVSGLQLLMHCSFHRGVVIVFREIAQEWFDVLAKFCYEKSTL